MPGTKRDRSEALALDPAAGPLLLVDQETGSRTMLERGLAKYGFEVVTVAGGQAALAAVAERPFAFAVVEMVWATAAASPWSSSCVSTMSPCGSLWSRGSTASRPW